MPEPEIIFENDDFLVINKPAGLMVHGVRVGAKRRVDATRAGEPTLVDWLRAHRPQINGVGDDPAIRPGIVHRLDKATSGVIIVAKTQASFEALKKLFQEHRIKKTYLALVRGVPKNGTETIDAPIGIKTGSLKRSVHSSTMAKPAVTQYSVRRKISEGATEQYALLTVNPKTGRTHQIRVHLASIGHPIVGDTLYGGKRSLPATRLMLHAAAIEFSDGHGNHFEFEAPLPDEFSAFL